MMLTLLVSLALGDVALKNHGTAIGAVTTLDCGAGVNCSRSGSTGTITSDGGSGVMFVRPLYSDGGSAVCLSAGIGDAGCVSNGSQAFSGDKRFAGMVGVGPTAPIEWLDVTGGGAMIRGANAGASSEGLTLEYAGSEGYVGAVTWTTSWRKLNLLGSEVLFQTSTAGLPTTAVIRGEFNRDGVFSVVGNDATLNGLRIPVVHGSGTAAQAIEPGASTFSTGTKAITFSTAFGAAPHCNCTTTSATVPCSISVDATTSGVTFAGTGSDKFEYICVGQR